MAKTTKTSGRGAPEDQDLRAREEEEDVKDGAGPTGATPASKQWGGLVPAGVLLGLILMAIVLALLSE